MRTHRFLVGALVAGLGLIAPLHLQSAAAAGPSPGKLDTTFGDGGVAAADLPGFDYASASAIQPDGKVVLAGASDDVLTVARFTANGRLDPSFGQAGAVRLSRSHSRAAAVRIMPNGSIVVAGNTWRTPHRSSNQDVNNAISLLADGGRMVIAKLTPTGALDVTFGRGGFATRPPHAAQAVDDALVDMVLTPSGSVAVLGVRGVSAGFYGYAAQTILEQFTPTGVLDTTFGINGVAPAGIPSLVPSPVALAVQPDGKLVVGATFVEPWFAPFMPPSSELLVSRYLPTGQPDSSFGVLGFARHDVDGGADRLTHLDIARDGRILLFADTSSSIVRLLTAEAGSVPWRLVVVRLTPTGALDPSFGTGGVASVPNPVNPEKFDEVLVFTATGGVQPDGRVLVAALNFKSVVKLYRLRADGQPDGGFATSAVPLGWVSSLAVADRRVIAGGVVNNEKGVFGAAAFAS